MARQSEKYTGSTRAERITRVFSAVARAVAGTRELKEVCRVAHRCLDEVMVVTDFSIALIEGRERTLRFPYRVNSVAEDFSRSNESALHPLTDLVVTKKAPQLLGGEALKRRVSEDGIREMSPLCWMGCPLMVRDEVVGVLEVRSYRDDKAYDRHDLEVLAVVAQQIALAIDRKRSLVRLEKSEAVFRALSSATFEAVFLSEKGVCIGQNSTAQKMFGYTAREAVGREAVQWIVPEDRELVAENMAAGTETPYQVRALKKDGTVFQAEIQARMLRLEGRPIRVTALRDISGQKKAEQELLRSEGHLRTLVQTIPDLVWLKDEAGIYLACNHTFERFFGAEEKDIIGRTDYDYVDKELADFFRENDRKAVQAGKPHINEEWITFADNGRRVLLETIKTPMFDAQGNLIGVLGVGRDITARQEAEKEREHLQETINQARKIESIGLLAGGIAHDFNNLLSGIFGNIELAVTKLGPDQEASDHIRTALESLQRARGLTNQLLTFAKGGDPIKEAVNLREMIGEVVSFNLSGSPVKAEFNLTEKLWPIQADSGQISQVIANLVINAKQAMASGGRVEIMAANLRAGDSPLGVDSVRLTVRDQGGGIEQAILNRIFDPYFSTKETGNGLGLAMARSIVEKHMGHIDVVSDSGVGATFTVYLPAEVEKDFRKRDSTAAQKEEKPEDTGLNVLVIDDEPTVRMVLSEMLQYDGYTVDVADEGGLGLQKYCEAMEHRHPYDLVLLDLTIPGGKGGKETVRDILAVHPSARVIAISGYSTDPIMSRYEQYGFKGRIAKPFKIKEVQEEVLRVSRL